ncbi:hypothetical protein [Vibrio parahaemolyticus]|uniref:hypothetical protein n=1 Tax=Vibrio parahaemolyticus TaxID=670 RepID=UPI001EEC0F83|nr:hypothetical protein [Vibrio parahaemolyticus]MCG6428431.1 hypothetical protein [Vibrio parahaemolyticus]
MYRTSDERHLLNHKQRDKSRTIPIVKVNPDKVHCRRRIEDILKQRRINADFEL